MPLICPRCQQPITSPGSRRHQYIMEATGRVLPPTCLPPPLLPWWRRVGRAIGFRLNCAFLTVCQGWRRW